jgi:hypothetical protein
MLFHLISSDGIYDSWTQTAMAYGMSPGLDIKAVNIVVGLRKKYRGRNARPSLVVNLPMPWWKLLFVGKRHWACHGTPLVE